MKKCPYCGKIYPDDVSACTVDQSLLVAEASQNNDSVVSKLNHAEMAAPKKRIVVYIGAVLIIDLITPFTFGFLNLNEGYLFLLLPVELFAALGVPVVVAVLMRGIPMVVRILIGVMLCIMLFAVVFNEPPWAISWTLGLSANFRLIKNPAKIQEWATGVLDRYENGKLATTTNVEYWATGRDGLAETEIPPAVRTLWRNKPSIGIATITDNGWIIQSSQTNPASLAALTGGIVTPLKLSHAVVFSWYNTGIMVGRTDFRLTWNPWYIHEIMPGVYAFHGQR